MEKPKKTLFNKKKDETAAGVVETGKKKKKKKWIILLIVLILIIAVIGGVVKKMTSQASTASNLVEIEPVEKRDLSDSVSLKGTVAGQSKMNVMSIAAAEITAVNVQVGDIVKEGDPLVSLDQEDIEKQIAELKTSINNADALAANDIKQKQESLSEAKQDQISTLNKASDAISKAQAAYDELVKKRDICQADIVTRKGQLSSTAAAKDVAKTEMDAANNAYQAAQAAATADPTNEALAAAAKDAGNTYAQKQGAYNQLAADCDTLTALVNNLETELATYPDALKTAQEAIDTAKSSYSDAQTSTDRSVSSAQNSVDMQKYQTSTTTDQKDQLAQLEKQLKDCTLYAPCGGVVTAVNVSVGDKNTAGATMITIENTSVMKVVVSVEEADILKLQEGMEATVTTDATGDEEIKGTVTRVVRVKNQSSNANGTDTNTATGYSAEITIDNNELLVGMSAKAKIVIKNRGIVLAVPYDLIQTDENGKQYVLVAQTNGDGTATAVRKDVTVGEEIDYYTEITGGDLQEGDQLIYDYSGMVTEGQVFSPEQMYSNQMMDGSSDGMGTEAE